MKKLLCILSLLMLSALAFSQTNLPPCDPNYTSPNCTDYFGVANWANSPLPAGTITGFTVKASGSGYSTPTFTMTDVNTTAPVALTLGFTLNTSLGLATVTGTGPAGSIAPQITVTDMGPGWVSGAPTCGGLTQPACGSGAVVLATIGGTITGGLRKFQDALTLPAANLTLGIPDTTTFPGADYYVIGLVEYSAKMHADLPPTRLRGYCQMNTPTAPGVCTPSYLGPTIIATKDRPVRVLFKNMLPTGAGGNLFIPTDTTYMGAGAPYTQNRATLHLHGGATPWISDGTPHQWTAPAGDTGPARGASVQFVPDMWFDSANFYALIPSCAGQPTCAAAGTTPTNDPGPGNLTFFWTNQQGGRLMFYHDHAYGITRLNVYAGEAAGYLLVDPTEEALLAAATVPGTIGAAPDLMHLVPLVIQDKTFVPTPGEVAFEDPTWLAGFGTTPGLANPGDLWFPHVYITNQNPADPGGANAFGRWDYGPWTLPGNQTVLLAANPETAVTIPCTSSAFPNTAIQCPITPNPSGTPEAFMDTPVVNGKAYPVLHVAPEAYRFQILSAGNDRSWNLQWYVADPTVTTLDGRFNTEVKMLPSVQPSTGTALPLCTQITPITNTTLFMGLATGLLDTTGAPLNGTGLPAGCWPNFGAGSQAAGIPIQQTMWAADGRAGGVPDPTTAGPAWIEIGTEGGLLPAPVVIPSMPIGYEANTRSVTITNVSVHGLWLGPAERADAVVDFSKFGGKTLILYNDAPTPAPAVDSRLDYFTGDGDQTPIGGAPNTLAGFGPNTRTIMQVVVDQPTTGAPAFNLPALQAALPGIFAQTQPQIIVPEPTYPPASGGYSPVLTYSLISDASLTFTPVGSITPVTYTDERKTIQELFTLDYGRMNATLGVELPLTNFLTQTTIPLGYIDPITEVMMSGPVYPATSVPLKSPNDNTQLWHITHNGVDTHFIHFHLFNVQVINRSGWDGTVRPIDQNELGWKDTVRMNPLEDILVAIQPIQPAAPFPVRDSYRLLDVTMMPGSDCPAPVAGPSPLPCSIFTDVNPASNNPQNTPNVVQDFGWEYVWHCHILGHEENDMMRAIAFNVPPEAPSNLTVAAAVSPATGLTLTFTDNSASETGFTVQRDVTAAFASPTSAAVGPSTPTDGNGQGITYGGSITYNDTAATGAGPYFYRVQAFKPLASYWSSGTLTSAWSNTAALGGTAGISPAALAFGSVVVGSTSPAQTVTISNTGTLPFDFTSLAISPGFATATNNCQTLNFTGTCTVGVVFTPTAVGPVTGALTIGTTDPANPILTVSLTGIGINAGLPALTITANTTTMKYGTAVPSITFSYNPPNPVGLTTLPSCTATVPATPPAIPVGTYPTNCSGAAGPYTITYVTGTLSVTPVPLTIWAPNLTMTYGSTPVINPFYTGFVGGDTVATLSAAPNKPPVCTTTATSTSPVSPPTYASTCSGAVDPNYSPISYVAGTVTIIKAPLTVTGPTLSMTYGGPIPPLPPIYTGFVLGDTPASLTTQPTCTTTATVTSPVSPPTYPVTCSGGVSANYAFTYVAGAITVTPAALTITANNTSKTYGQTVTFAGTEFTATGLLNGNTVTSVTLTSAGAAATATVSGSPYPIVPSAAVGTGLTNYTITYVNGNLTVNPAVLTITANNATKIYGQMLTFLGTEFTATGLLNGDTVTSVTLTSAGAAATATVSGSPYPIVPSAAVGTGVTNYTITYVNGALTVTPAAASVTPNAATKVYGMADPVPLTTGTLTGFTAADLALITATYSRAPGETVAGSPYLISATLSPAAVLANYTITYNTAAFTITPALASVTPNAATKLYGTADPVPLTTGTLTGFTAADLALITATYSRAPGETVAGSPYPISATLSPAAVLANYTITYNTAAFTITPALASVTPNAATKVYGTADPAFSGTLIGFQPADGVTAAYSRNAGENVGSYTISATLSPAAVLTNYTITYNTAAFTITAKAASVTPNAATKVYGTADPAFTGTLIGFLPADGVTAAYSRNAGENVGPYTISATLSPAAVLANYTITYNTATFTITPAALTVTANPATKVYGAALPALTATAVGLVPPDTVASIGIVCGTTATATSGVGAYPITCAGVPANYTVTYFPGTLTVTKAALTVTANNASRIWGFANPAFTATAVGLVGTDTLASIGVSCTSAATPASAVGTYPITCAGTPVNYALTSNPGTLTVTTAVQLTPASLTFAVQNVGTTSPFQTVTLQNIGGATLTTVSITFTGVNPGDFIRGGAGGGTCGATLAAGATCTINVRFRPTASGVRTANLSVTAAGSNSGTVALTGTGNGAAAAVTPATTAAAPFNFGGVTRGQLGTPVLVTVTNSGTTPLTFNAANGFTLGGANAGQFRLATGGSCVNGGTLAALASCTFTVNFAPAGGTALGVKNATVTIRSNATNGNQFVYLTGTAQ